jgi:DNA replication initiation complex subunit (GINS family)
MNNNNPSINEDQIWADIEQIDLQQQLGFSTTTTTNNNIENDFFYGNKAPRAIKALHQTLVNELAAPELLPYRRNEELLRRVKEELDQRVIDLEQTAKTMGEIEKSMYQLDVDRVRYALSALMRIRLGKIQKFAMYLVNQDHLQDPEKQGMSPLERTFAVKYAKLRKSFLTDAVLSRLITLPHVNNNNSNNNNHPSTLAATAAIAEEEERLFFQDHANSDNNNNNPSQQDVIMRPNLRTFVVCHVNKDIGDTPTVFGDDASLEKVTLVRGMILTCQYEQIRGLLKEGDVNLL